MRRSIVVSVAVVTIAVASSVFAQETRTEVIAGQQEEKARQAQTATEKPGPIKTATAWIESHHLLDWMKPRDPASDGFWIGPRIGGITRGAGFALGPEVIVPLAPHWLELHAVGSMSTKRYRLGRAELVSPHLLDDHLELAAGATYRYFPEEDYWGVGPDSTGPRTNYLLESREYRASARITLSRLSLGAIGGSLRPRLASGRDRAFPSTEAIFTPHFTPGLDARPELQYGTVFLDLDTRDYPWLVHRGTHLRVAASRYLDRETDRFTFNMGEAEALQVIPLVGETHRLVLFGRVVAQKADIGHAVPFYLMPWLGGDDTVRSEETYRFRDLNLAQANAEYQWEVFDFMDMAVFADAGNVAPRLRDFSVDHLKTAYGIGVRFHTNHQLALRVDAALGGSGARRVMVRMRTTF